MRKMKSRQFPPSGQHRSLNLISFPADKDHHEKHNPVMLQRDEHLISVRSHSFGEIDHRLAAHFDRVAEELVRRGELSFVLQARVVVCSTSQRSQQGSSKAHRPTAAVVASRTEKRRRACTDNPSGADALEPRRRGVRKPRVRRPDTPPGRSPLCASTLRARM